MAQLVRDKKFITDCDVADTYRKRLFGLMGRREAKSALYITKTSSIHTLFMRFPIEVAYVDTEGTVLDLKTMSPWRIGKPRINASSVIEAPAGAFTGAGVTVGDRLELRS